MAITTPLGYIEFGRWYDSYRAAVLEPALLAASSNLDALMADGLSDRDQTRIRKSTGRIKSKHRTWRKLSTPRYLERVATIDDIPNVVDDLVGLRITCTNVRDIDMVQAALDALPRRAGRGAQLWLDAESERDYVRQPKESGYRGWHVNLGVALQVDGRRQAVTCELQVRSLLQDSWGELTHEDTYSKDGALPPLVEVLSKRMADLFATLDDIAEDLRAELDRIDELAVVGEGATVDLQEDAVPTDGAAEAATMLVTRWTALDRPTELASLAWALQREFGAEISDDWFGERSFKRFLLRAVPGAEISSGRQAYLLPPGYAPALEDGDGAAPAVQVDGDSTVPEAARALQRIDRDFPLLEASHWPMLYGHLADAWRELGPGKASNRLVNQLTRSARDRADRAGAALSRRHLDYVVKAVLDFDGTETAQPLDAAAIAEAFGSVTVQRMVELRILGNRRGRYRAAVRRWMTGDPVAGAGAAPVTSR